MARIELPPGVVSQRSRRSNVANWRETNLMRWENGTLRPVGGWERVNYATFPSPIRAMHRWIDNSGKNLTAFLCEEHCFVDDGSGVLYDITPADGITPPASSGLGGFGDEEYNIKTYGTPRDAVERLNVATPSYTLDNWGQDLRVMTSGDGRLLGWSPSSPLDPLEPIENAPVGNRSFAVTPERHIILFGASGVDQQFMWSDQENDTIWTPSTTSKAGSFYVEPAAPIMAHRMTAAGILMFTARAAYIIRHIGLPYVYNYELVLEAPPPYSPASVVDTPSGTFWASLNGFWLFDGNNATPVDCPIWDWIDQRIDRYQTRFYGSMVNIAPQYEIWWFFSGGSEDHFNDYVVIYNYKDKVWSMGALNRNCGVSGANDPYPLLATEYDVWKHETGFMYPGTDRPWAETFTLNATDSTRLSTIKQMFPEIVGDKNAVQFRFVKRNNPTSGPETVSPAKHIRDNGFVDVRETARDFRMRVEMVGPADWSMGPTEMDLVMRGKK